MNILILLAFLFALFTIAAFSRSKHLADYYASSKSVGIGSLVASYLSTNVGGGTLIALAAIGFQGGVAAIYLGLSYALGFALCSKVATKIKKIADEEDLYSLSDFVRHFYSSKRLEYLISIVTVLAYFMFLVVQILGLSFFVSLLTDISREQAIIGVGILVALYSAVGGLKVDIRTDVFQAAIMVVVISIFVIYSWNNNLSIDFSSLPEGYLDGSAYAGYAFVAVAALILGPSILASMDVWQRIIAARDEQTAKKSLVYAAAFLVPVFVFFSYIGIYAYQSDPTGVPEDALISVAESMPSYFSYLVSLLFLASITSTADSLLVVIVTSLFNGPYLSNKGHNLLMIKVATLSVGGMAVVVAIASGSIVGMLSNALSSVAILLPALLLPLFGTVKERSAFVSLSASILVGATFIFIDKDVAFIPSVITSYILYFLLSRFEQNTGILNNV